MFEQAYKSNITPLKALAILVYQILVVYLVFTLILPDMPLPANEFCINAPPINYLCIIAHLFQFWSVYLLKMVHFLETNNFCRVFFNFHQHAGRTVRDVLQDGEGFARVVRDV
jgi:hypothetical protein